MSQSFTSYPLQEHRDTISPFIKNIKVDAFVSQLNDGDLIFSRSDSFEGRLIQLSGHCIWNHVAMCVYKHWCEATNDDTVYVHDQVETKNPRTGVKIWNMLSGLKTVLQNDTTILLGVSRYSSTADSQEHGKQLWHFWTCEQGKPYTPNYSTLLFSWLDACSSITSLCCWTGEDDGALEASQSAIFKNSPTTENYFCSQIVVECLRQTGIMIDEKYCHVPATEWTVANLANAHRLKNNLCNNFKYAEIEFFRVTL